MITRDRRPARGEWWRSITADGGMYVVDPDVDPALAHRALTEAGARAVRVEYDDITWLAGLDLRHLAVTVPLSDPAPLAELPGLVGLQLDAWEGELPPVALDELKHFGCTDVGGAKHAEQITDSLGRAVRSLELVRWPGPDLDAFGELPDLVELSVSSARRLVSPSIAAMPSLERLELDRCAALDDLGTLEGSAMQGLRVMGCRRVDAFDSLLALDSLRSFGWESSTRPPLDPLVSHHTLRRLHLTDGKRADDELSVLHAAPAVEWVRSRRRVHVLADGQWVVGDDGTLPEPAIAIAESALQRYRDDTLGPPS